ncbi:MAG TPA: SRPBCC family protein, partial [Mycobacterium sp.]
MACVDVGVSSDLSPERAWELASDLRRFDEWLTIFGGWKSEVPA